MKRLSSSLPGVAPKPAPLDQSRSSHGAIPDGTEFEEIFTHQRFTCAKREFPIAGITTRCAGLDLTQLRCWFTEVSRLRATIIKIHMDITIHKDLSLYAVIIPQDKLSAGYQCMRFVYPDANILSESQAASSDSILQLQVGHDAFCSCGTSFRP